MTDDRAVRLAADLGAAKVRIRQLETELALIRGKHPLAVDDLDPDEPAGEQPDLGVMCPSYGTHLPNDSGTCVRCGTHLPETP